MKNEISKGQFVLIYSFLTGLLLTSLDWLWNKLVVEPGILKDTLLEWILISNYHNTIYLLFLILPWIPVFKIIKEKRLLISGILISWTLNDILWFIYVGLDWLYKIFIPAEETLIYWKIFGISIPFTRTAMLLGNFARLLFALAFYILSKEKKEKVIIKPR